MNKKWIYPLSAIILGLIVFFFYNRYRVAPSIDFNKISLVNMNQEEVPFAAFNGKKKIVCFSASWCPNCLHELKEINDIKVSDLNDVEVIVISDEAIEKIKAFKDKKQYSFTFLKMKQAFSEVGINSIPTSYLVNGRQEVKKETVGYIDWKDASALAHMKKLLE